MYCIFLYLGGYRNIFLYLHPRTLKTNLFRGRGIKNDVTEMIHLLTFQSINNVLCFFKFGGYRKIFYTPPLHLKNLFAGGYEKMK